MRIIGLSSAFLLAFALLLFPTEGGAQVEGFPSGGVGPGGEVVDRVAAVVGDSIVLQSQVMQQLQQMSLAGQSIPTDPEALRALQREITEAFVNEMLLAQAAERDTLVNVTDEQVDEVFDRAWDEQVRTFGGEAALREALEQDGMQLARYRQDTRTMMRRNLLIQTYRQQRRSRLQGIAVDEAEVREFFEREQERLGERPATLTIQHLFLQAQASDEEKAAARERAEEILEMIRDGEDFADLARRFSDDPGSRQQGGDLGWYRRGDGLVEEFEDVAFRLGERQVSGVVETDFGAHILRIERVRGPERKIHHILVAAEPSGADEATIRERARAIAEEVRAGRSLTEFSREAAQVGIPDSITLAQNQLDELPADYAAALRSASEGDVVGPIEFPVEGGLSVYVVAQVRELREAGAFTFEDVRDQIRNILREEKLEERLLSELRARTYVDIRL